MEPQKILVAAVQFEPTLNDKRGNVDRLLPLVTEAAEAGARVIVTPEMATTGYCWYDRREIADLVEPIPGPTTEVFGEIARQYGCYIVVGMPEVNSATGIYYNSAALVGPDGLVGSYRKTHSFVSETKWAKDGDLGLRVWETPYGRLGILICADADFVEPARVLTLAGAEILCFPTNWQGEKAPVPAWVARAWENGCPLISANRYGLERGVQFCGGSCIIGADGLILAHRDIGDGVVMAEISLDPTDHAVRLGMRRPELYETQTLSTYLWSPDHFHGLYGHNPLPSGAVSRVAVIQLYPRPTLVETLSAADEMLRATDRTPDIIVLPDDTAASPRVWDTRDAQSLDDAVVTLRAFSQQHVALVAKGILERNDDRVFATALLVGPEGLLTHTRRIHLTEDEHSWLSPGDAVPACLDLPLGRLALAHGSDLAVPEFARELALHGCDLVLSPAGGSRIIVYGFGPTSIPLKDPLAANDDPTHMHLARLRAAENHIWLAWATPPEPNGAGHSGIFGPGRGFRDGEELLDPEAEGIIIREVDTAHRANRTKDTLRRRQPRDYDLLQLHYEVSGVENYGLETPKAKASSQRR